MKNVKKPKSTKSNKNLPGKFSRLFSNKKIVVLVVFVLAFSLVGSYRLYSTSAAGQKTVNTCRDRNITLRRGSTGPCVETVQKLMTAFKNFNDPSWPVLRVDGQYGPQTEATVRKYQKLSGIAADGVVGPQTWRALDLSCIHYDRDFGKYYSGCDYFNG